MARRRGLGLTLLLALAAPAAAQSLKERAPDSKVKGKLLRWRTDRGLTYTYRIPKSYSKKKGAHLLLFLRGSDRTYYESLVRYHEHRVRDDDIFLYAGLPSYASGGSKTGSLEFHPDADLARRIHDAHAEFKRRFKVRGTTLYGVGDGASFALYYAGTFASDVQAVCADSPAVWKGTAAGPAQAHQALLLMHVAGDSRGFSGVRKAFDLYTGRGLPRVRLSVVHYFDENPVQSNIDSVGTWQGCAAHRIAWCRAMSSLDPDEVAAEFDEVATVEDARYHDYAALYSAALRLAAMSEAGKSARARAQRIAKGVERLAEEHARALRKSLGKNRLAVFDDEPWVGHLPCFLDGFAGVPARDKLAAELGVTLERHRARAENPLEEYAKKRATEPRAAFAAAAEVVRKACLHEAIYTYPMATDLRTWRKTAAKPDQQAVDRYVAARRAGVLAYYQISARFRPR